MKLDTGAEMQNISLMQTLYQSFLNEVPESDELIHFMSLAENHCLKLAVVTETWAPDVNGVAHSIGKIVHKLVEMGVDVQLYYIDSMRDSEATKKARQNARISYYPMKGMELPFYKEVKVGFPCSRKLEKIWRETKPDVVQIVTEGALGFSAMKASKRLNIPAVSDYHTNFQLYSRFYKVGFLEKIVLAYLRRLHNQTKITLVPTMQLKKQLEELKFTDVEIMARGIDTEVFNPDYRSQELRESWGIAEDELVVLFVGRLAAEKNIELAVQAVRAMQAKNLPVKFVLVGDGPMRAKLEPNNRDFIFCGMQTGEALSQHYASGDIFLAPSNTETFGNTILEAMASKLATVSYDYASTHEFVVSGENGISVPFDDEQAFIEQAVALASDRTLIDTLAENALKSMQDNSWESVSKGLLKQLFRVQMEKQAAEQQQDGAPNQD